jgi:hypothetical protein
MGVLMNDPRFVESAAFGWPHLDALEAELRAGIQLDVEMIYCDIRRAGRGLATMPL